MHKHYCVNRHRGCEEYAECFDGWVPNDGFPDRVCASEEHFHGWECEECAFSPYCEDCGAMESLNEPHDEGCSYWSRSAEDDKERKTA